MKIFLSSTILVVFFLGFIVGHNFDVIRNSIILGPETQIPYSLFQIVLSIATILITGLIGYAAGVSRTFREEKQKIYSEVLPPILSAAYGGSNHSEETLNKAISRLLLYGNKKVAIKLEGVSRILADSSRGNITDAIQNMMSEMRKDIQVWFWQKLTPQDFNHIYFQLKRLNKDNAE